MEKWQEAYFGILDEGKKRLMQFMREHPETQPTVVAVHTVPEKKRDGYIHVGEDTPDNSFPMTVIRPAHWGRWDAVPYVQIWGELREATGNLPLLPLSVL